MAKVKVAKSAVQAVTAPAPQSTVTVPVDDLAAMMAGTGVVADEKKASKSSTVTVKISDVELAKKVRRFIKESAKKKAADGKMAGLGEDIRPSFEESWTKLCREQQVFHKTICMDDIINFGSPQLKVASPNDKLGTTQNSIKAGLKAHFADEYAKYVEDTITIFVKPEKTNAVTIKMLQDALGAKFSEIFSYETNIGLKKVGSEKDAIVVLKRDAVMLPATEKKVVEAIDKNLLSRTSGALTPLKPALAIAEEEILKENITVADVLKKAGEQFVKGPVSAVMAATK